MSLRRRHLGLFLAAILCGCGGGEPATTSTGTGGMGGTGGMLPVEPPLPGVDGVAPFTDTNADPHVVEVDLVARPHEVALLPGAATKLLNYNDQLPGPLLHARVGDRVIVHFKNELDDATVIHWHGLRISDTMDGSPMIQNPVQPGESFTYDFVVPDAGTFWYHTHYHQTKQFELGLYGAIVVHEKDFPVFSGERVFLGDDIRLDADNQVSPFETSGPDIGMGRVGNTLLVNGQVVNGAAPPPALAIPRGAIERWRFVLATNSLAYGLRIRGADARVIATDGGLLPQPFPLKRVEIAPGQRYDFEVRPQADATEVVLEALIKVLDANDNVVEQPFTLVRATVTGEVTAAEPVYPAVTLPPLDDAAPTLDWKLAGGVVLGAVQFSIDGKSTFVGKGPHDHPLLHTFEQNMPVKIKLTSSVSPAHPFHIHGQFFQIIERGGKPVDEPGLRDTVHVRGNQSATILGYFENPGMWMVHCHISEHGENGMMGDIHVAAPAHNH